MIMGRGQLPWLADYQVQVHFANHPLLPGEHLRKVEHLVHPVL